MKNSLEFSIILGPLLGFLFRWLGCSVIVSLMWPDTILLNVVATLIAALIVDAVWPAPEEGAEK